MIPEDAQYTEEHEWVRAGEGSIVTVGITHYAQEALGDINSDPYGEGWLFRIGCGDEAERNRQLEGLMSAREYEGLTGGA